MPTERAESLPHQPSRRTVPVFLRRGVALLLAFIGTLFLASMLFHLIRSFLTDYPEEQFDLRVLAALLFGYGSLFAASARALWRGRVRLWLPLAALAGFLLPFISYSTIEIYDTLRTGEFSPQNFVDDLRTSYGPPFTVIHAVLYGCLALAVFTFWWWLRERAPAREKGR
ncbi:MAG: hypothetical protein RMK01_03535 [Thermomicrobium sp.]|nr:hypothetical protein [Thermomicrobium sp.]